MNNRDKEYFLRLFEQNKPDYCLAIVKFEKDPDNETYHLLCKSSRFHQFIHFIRKTRKLPANKGFIFLAGEYMITGNQTIQDIYDNYKGEDNFLHITITEERIFG